MDDGHSHLRSFREYRKQLKITKEIEEYYNINGRKSKNDALLDEIAMELKCRFALECRGLKTNGDILRYVNELTALNERYYAGAVTRFEYARAYRDLREDFYVSHKNGKEDRNSFLERM